MAGNDLTAYRTSKEKLKISAYGRYLRRLIREGQLEDRVQLALLLAKGYAALDSRPYGGSLALALYPLKETE